MLIEGDETVESNFCNIVPVPSLLLL